MKIGAIIQARMGSSRLPGKVMKEIQGKTVLYHVIERVKQSKLINEIIIATTVNETDNIIEEEAIKCGAKVSRGSEDNVLSRYYYAAKEYNLDVIIRITSDCPLIDPQIVDELIKVYLDNDQEIVTSGGLDLSQRSFPRGLDAEVFSFEILKNAFDNASDNYQLEHVTPYIYENASKIYIFKSKVDYSKHRWTLDTVEDLELISRIYKHLYNGKHDFHLNEIVELFNNEPELFQINAHIEQKKIK